MDVIFCEKELEGSRFVLMSSLKVNRELFFERETVEDHQNYPIDFAITVAHEDKAGARFENDAGIIIANLPLNVDRVHYAWENATKIVQKALEEMESYRFIRFFRSFFKAASPQNYWVEFLAKRDEQGSRGSR